MCLSFLYLAQGNLGHAMRVLDQGLALCRASSYRVSLSTLAAGLGQAYALQERLAAGHALVEEAIEDDVRTGGLQASASRVARLSEVCRLAGRSAAAGQYARQALALARQLKEHGSEAHALYQLGAVQAHTDPPDVAQAEAHYQQALALAEELGMRPLVAHCHAGLDTLYTRAGRWEQAPTALTAALALYRAMAMTFCSSQCSTAAMAPLS
jgi:tetratricopeptide (TPR) repeat protein